MKTGDKIKNFRYQVDMTQQELAVESGLSISSIKKYEANIRTPKPSQLHKIAKVLCISADLLSPDAPLVHECKTEGDVFALLRALDTSIPIKLIGKRNELGYLCSPDDVAIVIDNEAINEILLNWDIVRQDYYKKVLEIDKNAPAVDWVELDRLQQQKLKFEKDMCDNNESLEKSSDK